MTDRDLLALYHGRMAALEATNRYPGCTLGELRKQAPEKRAEVDHASTAFHLADVTITAELRDRGQPAKLKGVTLWLTNDLRSFAALEPGEESVKGWTPKESKNIVPTLLCTY